MRAERIIEGRTEAGVWGERRGEGVSPAGGAG